MQGKKDKEWIASMRRADTTATIVDVLVVVVALLVVSAVIAASLLFKAWLYLQLGKVFE
jgi:hypothetical protein